MSGVLAAFFLSLGTWCALELPYGSAVGTSATATSLLLGVLLAVRSWSVYRARQVVRCTTCRGAGTVYSAEYNDWYSKGPVQNIRELCPACEGMPVGVDA